MIRHLETLPGLPGQTRLPIIHYGAAQKTGREGVVIRLEDDAGAWIGNFDSTSQPARLSPHLTKKGTAVIFADRFCHVLTARAQDEILEGDGAWILAIAMKLRGIEYLVCGSEKGRLVTLNETGREVGNSYFDCCEDLQFSIASDVVEGTYYEFNLKRRVPFRLTLPDLNA